MSERSTRFCWLLGGLFVLALALRLFGLDFDQSHWFHPDERRIAEAVSQLSFTPLQLNPHFFAYGSFPLYITRAVTAAVTALDPRLQPYGSAIVVGRALSAVWGAATVVLLALLARRLYGEGVGLLAGLLLAATVLHVQNSHFATNDVALTFLVLLALAFAAGAVESGKLGHFAGTGVAIGLAVATKFSALPLVLPLGVAALIRWRRERHVTRPMISLALAAGCALAAFVAAAPFALLDTRAFLHDILEQGRMVRTAGLVPYTTQYVGVPKLLYDLREMVLWGMGPLLGVAALVGTAWRVRRRPAEIPGTDWVLLAWVVPTFALTASFDVKFLRYLLPIYPVLVLWGAAWLHAWARRSRGGRWARATVVAGTALYLLAFLSIYARPHTAVSASAWFYDHVPPGSKVLSQEWDEGFPLPLPGGDPGSYRVVAFPFYEPDGPAKTARLASELAASDAVVFQTKRIYGAVTRAPERYPLTVNFFRLLFAGDLGYTLVRDVASRPGVPGLELPDELADESFSVYDHPKALIFKNTGHMSAAAIEGAIAHRLPSRPLSRSDLLLARAGEPAPGGRDPAGVVRSSLAATLLCALLLELLGLAAYAVLKELLPARAGLYALAKVIGVVLFAYVPWLAVSAAGLPFRQPLLLAAALLLGGAGWLAWRRRRELPVPRAELIATEGVVWFAFALFLALRALNPEIFWGEKPMDFAFLNTLYRSTALPPPEPWLAGSTLSYTYFGHFTVAAVGKALAIQPAVMFNLGIALTAALTAAALFAAGSLVGGSWRPGAIAAGLTLFAGNLAGVQELFVRHAIDFDYFWATSRVIPDTINEFPFWSFVFADLHAHLLVLPFSVALLALVVLWVGRRSEPTLQRPWLASLTLLALGALTLGAVTVTNGWSMPTAIALLLAVLGTDWLVRRTPGGTARLLRTLATGVVLPAGVIAGGALLAYRPFWRHFTPPASQWGLEVGPFARPGDVVTIFGAFLLLLVPATFVVWRGLLAPPGRPLTRGHRLAMGAVAAGLLLSLLDLPALASLSLRQAPSIRTFALALTAFGFALTLHRGTPGRARLPLLLSTFAMALIAGCELVFVWDRMNTVFKFYLESWVLLGVASSLVLFELFKPVGHAGRWTLAWRGAACAALAVALFTSLSGAVGDLRFRHTAGPRFTLDGMAYLKDRAPEELAALRWLNRNISGVPVLVEACGPSYREFGRVSMNTGLPTILGWDYHVFQRGHSWTEINRRKADVETIYTSSDRGAVAAALSRYRVAMVVVGGPERTAYAGGNLANFRRWTELLTPLFENPGVTVFGVNGAFPGVLPDTPLAPAAADRTTEARAGAVQDEPGTLRQPRGVTCDRGGSVYVADFGNSRIQKLGDDLRPVAAWGRRGGGAGEFRDPCGVAVGANGLLYVADTWNGRVQILDRSGSPLREFGDGLFGPRGIAVDAGGAVYVADTGAHRIVRFSSQGARERQFGGHGSEPGELDEPMGLAVDPDALVWVCDNGNARVQAFTRDGAFVRAFPVPGWRREPFSEPNIAVDGRSEVWVTVPLAGEVRRYGTAGTLLQTIRTAGEPARPLARPVGIALTPDGRRLLVTDIADGILQITVPGR